MLVGGVGRRCWSEVLVGGGGLGGVGAWVGLELGWGWSLGGAGAWVGLELGWGLEAWVGSWSFWESEVGWSCSLGGWWLGRRCWSEESFWESELGWVELGLELTNIRPPTNTSDHL